MKIKHAIEVTPEIGRALEHWSEIHRMWFEIKGAAPISWNFGRLQAIELTMDAAAHDVADALTEVAEEMFPQPNNRKDKVRLLNAGKERN